MDATDWEPLKRLFERASALPAEAQAAFLQDACAGDPAKQAQLESLLRAAEESEGFFDSLADAILSLPHWPDNSATGSGAEPDPFIGRTVHQYRIEEKLGRGGMGVVYRAHDTGLNRAVALKFLPPHLRSDDAAIERFLVEAQAAAALDHPNVCTVHEVGEDEDGRLFIAMAFYEGETLRQKLERGPLPIEEACAYAQQMAAGLGAAHAHGIVHRDVKPGNVILTPEGVAKVLDFGLAKLTDVTLTGTGTTLGTVAYMSPEQVRGEAVDHRTDLWSLGVVLYEMLTGKRPFSGDSTAVVFHAIQHEDPKPPSASQPGLPSGVDRVMARALAKPPDDRFQSADELARAFESGDTVGDISVATDGPSGRVSSASVQRIGLDILSRLKERRLVQWALAYVAGAWVVTQLTEVLAAPLRLSVPFQQGVLVILIIGFFISLVIAWYHGEKGRQRVSGPELLMVAALLVVAGAALSMLGPDSREVQREEQPASADGEGVAAALDRMPGIAILPFKNRSDLSSDQYFTDGIQDALLTRLQRVSGLKVISRTSSETYRDAEMTIPEIGRELNVGYILEGGVHRAGDRVRISVQLIDVEMDDHIWAEEYDRALTTENLFDMQSEIVGTVAGHLNVELREEERLRAARRSTTDLEAYELYLRGVDLTTRGREDFEEAILLFEQAIARDPEFPAAHAALARNHANLYEPAGRRSEERATTARAAAERALELAPESEDAQLAMGLYLYWVEKDYEAALNWLARASGTLVGDFDYHFYRGMVERRMGQWRQALASQEAATVLSPREPGAWQQLGLTYLEMRRYAEAESAFLEHRRIRPEALGTFLFAAYLPWCRDGSADGWQSFLERHPGTYWAWEIEMTQGRYEDAAALLDTLPDVLRDWYWHPKALLEAETLEALGQREAAREKYQDAADILESLIEETPDDERYHASLAWAYAGLGMRDRAVREAQRAVEILPRERDALSGPHFLFYLAAVHARLGRVDEALAALEDLLSAPSWYTPNMLEDHFRLRPIQGNPRFKALMDRERDRVF